MRERLYLAGYPTTPLGWAGFCLSMALGIGGTLRSGTLSHSLFIVLVLLSWLANLAIVHWPWQIKFLCHLATWVLIWRAIFPDPAWYQSVLVSMLLAGAVTFEQERRRHEQGPA
ncbi:MAG: hypothetical protein ACOY94_10780 [Bacillota bacterium]